MHDEFDIPRVFYSEYLETPFVYCIDCERPFAESTGLYSVMKHYVGTETVFEMAICLECAAKQRQRYSVESMARIISFIGEATERNYERLAAAMEDGKEPDWEAFTSECVFCWKNRSECHRYEIVGTFYLDQMIVQSMPDNGLRTPMMMCEDCNAELSKLLSKETRDSWDRFVEEHFDGPPGIEVDGPTMEPIFF